jgi:hypothetical protein
VTSSDRAGPPIALLATLLLLLGVAGLGAVAAGPDVLSPAANSTAAQQDPTVAEEEPEEGEESANETYLREALGDDFEIEGNKLIAESGEGLPEELTAYATVSLVQVGDGEFRCGDSAADDAEVVECEDRSVSGRTVRVETTAARHSASGSNFGERTVRYLRDDGYLVVVQLSVLGRPSDGSTTELEEDVSDWLASLEEALVTAALDDRMRPASE